MKTKTAPSNSSLTGKLSVIVSNALVRRTGSSENLKPNCTQAAQSGAARIIRGCLTGVLSLSLITSSLQAVTKEGNLLAHLKFDEGSGTSAADSSGNSNSGTLINSPAWVAGFNGNALQFNNTDKSVEIASFSGLSSASQFTLSAWVKLSSIGSAASDDGGVICSKQSDGNTALIWYNADAQGGGNPSYSFNVGTTGSNTNRVNGPVSTATTNWQNVVCVYQGATRKLYVDGVLKATQASGPTTSVTVNGDTIQIGKWSGSGNFNFNGLIDDVRVYDIALGDADVTAIYGGGNGDFGLPPTLSITGADPAKNFPVTVTAEFLDGATPVPVSGIDASDFTVTGGTLSNFTAVSTSKFTFDVTPQTLPAAILVSLPGAAGTVTATSGNTG